MTWLREHWRQVLVVLVAAVGFSVVNRLLPSFDVQKALHDVADAVGGFAYVLAGAAAFLETGAFVGLLVPGETFVILVGAVAGQGATSIWLTILVVWIGAFAGDSVSFLIGRRLGREFALKHGPRVAITPERLATVERYFERYGGRTVVIGRFIGLIRALAPFIAGTSGMRYRTYLPYGVAGTGLWAATFCLLGYFLSSHVNQAVHVAGRAGFWFGVAAVVAIGVYLGTRYLQRASERERSLFGLATAGAAAVCATAVVITFALIVASHPAPIGMDSSAFRAAHDIREGWVTDLAKAVTALGSTVGTVAVAGVAAVVLAVRRRWTELALLVAAVVATHLVVSELKTAIDRPRPPGSLVATENSAYPSGHSAQSVVFVWLGVIAGTRLRAGWGAGVIGLGLVLAVAVGFSRVYLRAHFLSDVLGGWGVGLAVFAIPSAIAILVAMTRVGNNQSDAAPAG